MTKRKLIYHVAISIDGFIAADNGSIDLFPIEGDHITDYIQSLTQYDTCIMGRRTYEFGYKYGMQPGDNPYPHMDTFICSRQIKFDRQDDNLVVVRGDIDEHLHSMKKVAGQPIFLCGGGVLASYLFQKHLIDEVHIKLCPIVMGSGVPLVDGLNNGIKLQLLTTKSYDNGVLLLQYKVDGSDMAYSIHHST